MSNLLSRAIEAFTGVPVSDEFRRIQGLPVRKPCTDEIPCIPGLWPIQREALWEFSRVGGLIGAIQAGGGKTLIALYAPQVVEAERPVIFTLPRLKDQMRAEGEKRGLSVPVYAYTDLSSPKKPRLLEDLRPDCLILDEAHALKDPTATRTKRVKRYIESNPDTMVMVLSGTLLVTLRASGHLARWALGAGSPLPRTWKDLESWGAAIDVVPFPSKPGVLVALCPHEHAKDDLEQARKAFRCRFVSTPGVVATSENSVGASLILSEYRVKVPDRINEALENFRKTWRIDTMEVLDPLAFHRTAKQLALGFYYRWAWPNGQKDYEWLEARSAWFSALRAFLRRNIAGLDSPLLASLAALEVPSLRDPWIKWSAVKDRPPPPVETVWLDRFAVDAAVKWSERGGLVWYSSRAFGEALALPSYGPGTQEIYFKGPAASAAVKVCGTGKDGFQRFYSRNLVTCPLSGAAWEQLLARTHRTGQPEDIVTADLFLHTKELRASWEQARVEAKRSEAIEGPQRILFGTWLDTDPEDG